MYTTTFKIVRVKVHFYVANAAVSNARLCLAKVIFKIHVALRLPVSSLWDACAHVLISVMYKVLCVFLEELDTFIVCSTLVLVAI